MSDYETIEVARSGRTATITLARPKALNALNTTLMGEVVDAVLGFDADPEIGAIVITGSERAFAAGADIKEMAAQDYADVAVGDFFSPWDRLSQTRTPLIAAIAGHALGGGCELAMLCDLAIAADNARFAQPEINLGTFPGIGGTQRLTRAVGKAVAMDLILTGRAIKAEEALALGLVSRVVPLDELASTAAEIAETIASKSLPVVYAAKEAVNRAFETTLSEGVRFERRTFHATFALADRAEGMNAFAEKRAANFTHR